MTAEPRSFRRGYDLAEQSEKLAFRRRKIGLIYMEQQRWAEAHAVGRFAEEL